MNNSAKYTIRVTPSAEKDIDKLKKHIQISDFHRIDNKVRLLASDPRLTGARKIRTRAVEYRIRAGKFRVVYEVDDTNKLVLILHVARRSETTYS
ncbi:MAG: type II toxin-antitoxin system RelE/ParE family toxin [Chloroflexi bacterium]|nr:type II toxin-antitoxin system RelE/ParE family toxin [Chloroflexota bacterium]